MLRAYGLADCRRGRPACAGRRPRSGRQAVVAAAGVLALGLSACSTTSSASAARPAAPGPGHDGELQSVSCAGPASCWAVGFSSPDQQAAVVHTLVESYSGRRWSLWPAPSPGPRSLLFGVSCRTRRFCQAVGSTALSSSSVVPDTPAVPQVPLAERFDGTRWLMEPAPALGMSRLQGVSCPTTTFCVAVGQRDNSTALIGQWNGRSWTTAPTGLPAPVRATCRPCRAQPSGAAWRSVASSSRP